MVILEILGMLGLRPVGLLQLVGCVYLSELAKRQCWIVQMFSIECLSAGNYRAGWYDIYFITWVIATDNVLTMVICVVLHTVTSSDMRCPLQCYVQ